MRRAVEILRKFKHHTGHEHPHWQVFRGNYSGLLMAMGKTDVEIQNILESLRQSDA